MVAGLVMFYLYSRDPVYFYEVPSSIGTSPHPCHWARMIALYGHNFGEFSFLLFPHLNDSSAVLAVLLGSARAVMVFSLNTHTPTHPNFS